MDAVGGTEREDGGHVPFVVAVYGRMGSCDSVERGMATSLRGSLRNERCESTIGQWF